MTPEELKNDTLKFVRYLEANGVHIVSVVVSGSAGIAAYGSNETITEGLLIALADRLGYRLEVKT